MKPKENPEGIRLGRFILEKMEVILGEWEDYARRYWEGPMPDVKTLRNDAEIMLRAVVADMATPQTPAEKKTKSEGSWTDEDSAIRSAALGHAVARVNDGFDIERMVAEFRALRASVARVWWESLPDPHLEHIEDMDRFNEALDQLVAVSVSGYTRRVEKSRRLFLGILGHDLRQPLNTLRITAAVMRETPGLVTAACHKFLGNIDRCCGSMGTMLSDLLDFTTTQLGSAMPVTPVPCDLRSFCGEIIEEVRATALGHAITLEANGDLTGEWDHARLRQLLSNLLMNALSHGAPGTPVTTTLRGSEGEVVLTVHNRGGSIPQESLGILFDPMVRMASKDADRPNGSVGLGLYICRQITHAHGGVIRVDSSVEDGTTFTVILPRHHTPQDSPEI